MIRGKADRRLGVYTPGWTSRARIVNNGIKDSWGLDAMLF
jgi:hypothetical protein